MLPLAYLLAVICAFNVISETEGAPKYGPRPLPEWKHKLILDILSGEDVPRNDIYQTACRLIRRWRQEYEVTTQHINIWGKRQLRILLDGKVLLKCSESKHAVKTGLKATKGGGYKRVTKELDQDYFGTSTRTTSKRLKELELYQESQPLFDNKAPLHPIPAKSVQERHQIDLVSMSRYPVKKGSTTYLYVLSVLDCFSRYLWLYPMESKSSMEVRRYLEQLYESEGHPKILQSDQGSEFKKAIKPFCKKFGIQRVISSAYHPQSQGKIERSHGVWKRMYRYDVRTAKKRCTDWVSRLSKYASIYNRQYHASLGTSPFHVYHGRHPNPKAKSSDFQPQSNTTNENVMARFDNVDNIRNEALRVSKIKKSEMVKKHLAKYPPSLYSVGDKVFVRNSKGTKIKTSNICKGVVRKADHNKHNYQIETASGLHWYSVTKLAATTREGDIQRRKYQSMRRIRLLCQCSIPHCRKFADLNCRNTMSKTCCLSQNRKCWLTSHMRRGIAIEDFVLPKDKTTEFIDLGRKLSKPSAWNSSEAHDSLVANALMLNLIPEGNIPRDGNCMFHAVAQSLQHINGQNYSQEEVRNLTVEWLRKNPVLNNGVHLQDFIYDMGWEEYLEGLARSEWGDHIALIAISNAFGVNIAVVSSENFHMTVTNPQNQTLPPETIYLGHEFETHYIRLCPMDSLNPIPASLSPSFPDVPQSSLDQPPFPSDQSPSPSYQLPSPSDQFPSPSDQLSSHSGQHPPPSDKQPPPSDQHSFPSNQSPSPSDQAPTRSNQPQTPSDQPPSLLGQRQSPSGHHPSPSDHFPSPSDQLSSHSDQHPRPSDQQPPPSDQHSFPSNQSPSPSDQAPTRSNQPQTPSDQLSSHSGQHPPPSDQQSPSSDQHPFPSDQHPISSDQNPRPSDKNPSLSDEQPPSSDQHPSVGLYSMPDEILRIIFQYAVTNAVTVGVLNNLWSKSGRIAQIVNSLRMPQIYLNQDVLQRLGEPVYLGRGVSFNWSVCKLMRVSGKRSGLAMRLRELLSGYWGWYHARLCLRATGEPGWFEIIDFVPAKGWKNY